MSQNKGASMNCEKNLKHSAAFCKEEANFLQGEIQYHLDQLKNSYREVAHHSDLISRFTNEYAMLTGEIYA